MPVIVMSANAFAEDVRLVKQAGITEIKYRYFPLI